MAAQTDTVITSGPFSLHLDKTSDIIRITGKGFVQVEQFDALFATLRTLFEASYARSGSVRLLVDNRDILLHGPEAAERLRYRALHSVEEGDRVAIIVESALSRMQLRRLLDPRTHRLFETEKAATAWLEEKD